VTVVFSGDGMAEALPRRAAGPPVRGGPAAYAPDGFAEFYAASYQALATQVYVYTGDLGLAQDLVQEAFCRALPRWAKLSTYDDPVAWVRRVAFNLAHNRWRRTKVAMRYLRGQREHHAEGPGPDRVAAVAALAQLPAVQRRAMVLHYLADLPVAEIAAQEGVAIGTVKSWLHRGRTALAGLLAEEGNNV
jgi:RNA polymerase sigma-70 factor (ECF subfamily)